MQIYFHSRLWSYLPRVPILVEGTVYLKSSEVIQCVRNRPKCIYRNSRPPPLLKYATVNVNDI